jgi:hypothetical protein
MSGPRSRRRKTPRGQRSRRPARIDPNRHFANPDGDSSAGSPEAVPSKAWEQLRQGARNVAGVSYQIAVTADLMVQARAGRMPLNRLIPEGYEDVDCLRSGGGRLYVQTKDVGGGRGTLSASEVADALAHAAAAVGDGTVAVVTDGSLGCGLALTGWTTTIAESGASGVDGLVRLLANRGLDEAAASGLLARAHLVQVPWHVPALTQALLREGLGLAAPVARIVYARLVIDLAGVAAAQRSTTADRPQARTPADLDAHVAAVHRVVDVGVLDEAVRSGVCEPVDFTRLSDLTPAQFYAGVDVAPSHIAADLDVLRPSELTATYEGLADQRYVLLAGPSGSGKSALLWRAARDVGRGARPVRVLRLRGVADVETLVRHVQLQEPNAVAPVLVCGDDLGRTGMEGWPAAVSRLLELPGVLLVGAARAEDLTPALSRDARVVDPRLDRDTATQIAGQVQSAGVATAMEVEEASDRAEGLLMEFLALLTTGRRLEAILDDQVQRVRAPGQSLTHDLLRLVCAAHTLASSVAADRLAAAATAAHAATAGQVRAALSMLQDEHLVVTDATGRWRGLHELRSATLVRLLHRTPPPTLTDTHAEVLPLLPTEQLGTALRIAAETLDVDPAPVADAAAALADRDDADARTVTAMLAGAERADTAVYARECLPILERARPPGMSLYDLAFLTYYIRQGGMRMPDIGGGPAINALADQLPERTPAIARRVAAGLTPERLAHLAVRAPDRESAVVLLEAAEGVAALTRDGVQRIIERHATEPPNPGRAVPADEVRAWTRLIASAAALARLADDDVAALFGRVDQRAEAVVAATPNGLTCHLERAPDGLVVGARLLAVSLPDAPPDRSEPPGPYGDPDSPNARAVALCRQLLDVCPEADIAEVFSVDANGREITVDGHKRIPRANLYRPTVTRVNVGWQAAVARLTMAPSWSARLRQQAQLAAALVQVLAQLPARLRPYDNTGRRRRWRTQVERLHAQAAALPRPPQPTDPEVPVGDLAAQDEAARRRDPPRAALEMLTQALTQLSNGLDADNDADRNHGGTAAQLRSASLQLEEARAAGTPYFAGIGDTLPADLADLAALAADLLLALNEDPRRARELKAGEDALPSARRLVDAVIATQNANEQVALDGRLREAGIDPEFRFVEDPDPPLLRVGREQCLVLVPVGHWDAAWQTLADWPAEEQEDLRSNITMAAVDEDGVLPIAARHFHAGDHASTVPITLDDLRPIVTKAGLPLLDGPLLEAATSLLDDIVRWSAVKARSHLRNPNWWQPQTEAHTEAQLNNCAHRLGQNELAPEAARVLREAFESVLAVVAAEPDGSTPLATEVAILPDPSTPPSLKLAAFTGAVLLAMEAQAETIASNAAQ